MKHQEKQDIQINPKEFERLTIGHATFKKSFTKQAQKDLIIMKKESSFSSNSYILRFDNSQCRPSKDFFKQMYWNLSDINCCQTCKRWYKLIKYIDQAQCEQFVLEYLRPSIIADIAHINFKNIMRLVFWGCRISSLQPLVFLDVQNIAQIQLAGIYNLNLKPLSKTKWDKLQRIRIEDPIYQQTNLNRIKTSHILKKGEQIEIGSVPIPKDLNVLAKLQPSTVELLVIDFFIKQLNASQLKTLKRKYLNLKVIFIQQLDFQNQDLMNSDQEN